MRFQSSTGLVPGTAPCATFPPECLHPTLSCSSQGPPQVAQRLFPVQPSLSATFEHPQRQPTRPRNATRFRGARLPPGGQRLRCAAGRSPARPAAAPTGALATAAALAPAGRRHAAAPERCRRHSHPSPPCACTQVDLPPFVEVDVCLPVSVLIQPNATRDSYSVALEGEPSVLQARAAGPFAGRREPGSSASSPPPSRTTLPATRTSSPRPPAPAGSLLQCFGWCAAPGDCRRVQHLAPRQGRGVAARSRPAGHQPPGHGCAAWRAGVAGLACHPAQSVPSCAEQRCKHRALPRTAACRAWRVCTVTPRLPRLLPPVQAPRWWSRLALSCAHLWPLLPLARAGCT